MIYYYSVGNVIRGPITFKAKIELNSDEFNDSILLHSQDSMIQFEMSKNEWAFFSVCCFLNLVLLIQNP